MTKKQIRAAIKTARKTTQNLHITADRLEYYLTAFRINRARKLYVTIVNHRYTSIPVAGIGVDYLLRDRQNP